MATTTNKACRLLQLPRELRNIIIEYALAEPEGLATKSTRSFPFSTRICAATSNACRDPNQLRLVCRQLHTETNALELVCNNIKFGPSQEFELNTVYDLFDRFYKTVSALNLKYVNTVTIFDNKTALSLPGQQVHLTDLLSPSLVRFCEQNPKAKVIVHFRWATKRLAKVDEMLDVSIRAAESIGNPHPFRFPGGHVVSGRAERLLSYFAKTQCPDNLHIYRCNTLNEGAESIVGRWGDFSDNGNLDFWIKCAKFYYISSK